MNDCHLVKNNCRLRHNLDFVRMTADPSIQFAEKKFIFKFDLQLLQLFFDYFDCNLHHKNGTVFMRILNGRRIGSNPTRGREQSAALIQSLLRVAGNFAECLHNAKTFIHRRGQIRSNLF